MQSPIRSVLALALAASLSVTVGCAGAKGAVTPNPSAEQIQALHNDVGRIADNFKRGLAIVRAAGPVIDKTAIATADKDAFDKAIIAVTGTTAAPGPLPKALDALKSVNDAPGLKAVVTPILGLIQPLIQKLEASPDQTVSQLGVALDVALTFAKAYVAGS